MCLPQATEREICSDSKYESKWKDPDYLLFLNVGSFFKSIKMFLWIWLVLMCQGTIYPKRLPLLGAKSWSIGVQNSVLMRLFSPECYPMFCSCLLTNFFLGKIWYILYGGYRARWYKIQLMCLQRLHKIQGFWICGNLYAAVLATACLIVNSDGMT